MRAWFLVLVCLVVVGCSDTDADPSEVSAGTGKTPSETVATSTNSAPPALPDGPVSDRVNAAVGRLLDGVFTSEWDLDTIGELVDLGDPRTGWILVDLMRFYQTGEPDQALVFGFSELTGAPQDMSEVSFVWATNHLLGWDLPAWDGYADAKRTIYQAIGPLWARFIDEGSDVDWRPVTWGGVAPDDRPFGDNGPCNCIPALDEPRLTDAAGGNWYDDERTVFGVVVGDETLALPKHQMEFHEMVNVTLGGRLLGIPYCTLCGSAQAYYLDDVPGVDRLVLRTSGLLRRSNKLMYDLTTNSAIDTFTGEAITGDLAEGGVVLSQVSVIAATWGDWKQAHPHTQILAQDGGVGRVYDDDPLRGRDDDGPIFPIGPVDPRLPVQERVVGVIAPDGTPIVFPVSTATEALAAGPIEYADMTVRLEDGLRFFDRSGEELPSHEAFWFAWSQFHQGTVVWDDIGS